MSDTYKIEKGIPLPGSQYPFRDMQVGDSFVTTEKDYDTLYDAIKIYTDGIGGGTKFVAKIISITPDHKYEIRCWRIL